MPSSAKSFKTLEKPQEHQREDESEENIYQMCYMPIVLTCIVIGALMIGLVIYFVEENNTSTN